MANEQFKCEVCNKNFGYPDWDCSKQPGHHSVPAKKYFHLGGAHIANVRDRRSFAPNVILSCGKELLSKEGDNVMTGRCEVQFGPSGVYETEDPQEQYFLDKKAGVVTGPEGEKRWQSIYLTVEQRKNIAEAEYSELQRKIKESNDALALAKRQTNG